MLAVLARARRVNVHAVTSRAINRDGVACGQCDDAAAVTGRLSIASQGARREVAFVADHCGRRGNQERASMRRRPTNENDGVSVIVDDATLTPARRDDVGERVGVLRRRPSIVATTTWLPPRRQSEDLELVVGRVEPRKSPRRRIADRSSPQPRRPSPAAGAAVDRRRRAGCSAMRRERPRDIAMRNGFGRSGKIRAPRSAQDATGPARR